MLGDAERVAGHFFWAAFGMPSPNNTPPVDSLSIAIRAAVEAVLAERLPQEVKRLVEEALANGAVQHRPEWMTTRQVAQEYPDVLSEGFLNQSRSQGTPGPKFRRVHNRTVLYHRSDIEAYLRSFPPVSSVAQADAALPRKVGTAKIAKKQKARRRKRTEVQAAA